jgi:hypothetical protein
LFPLKGQNACSCRLPHLLGNFCAIFGQFVGCETFRRIPVSWFTVEILDPEWSIQEFWLNYLIWLKLRGNKNHVCMYIFWSQEKFLDAAFRLTSQNRVVGGSPFWAFAISIQIFTVDSVTRLGRCYDHNHWQRFLPIFGKKLAFFSKTNVMIQFLNNLALFWAKNTKFFAKFFGKNI